MRHSPFQLLTGQHRRAGQQKANSAALANEERAGVRHKVQKNAKKSKTKREKHINYFRVRIVPRNGLRAKKSEQIAKEKNHEGAIRGLPLERGPFLRPARPAGACILATGFTLGPKKFLDGAPLAISWPQKRSRSRLPCLAFVHQRP